MRVAEFYLVNEKNEKYSLMDEINYCYLTEVSGLGCSYSTNYQQIGNIFISTLRTMEQGKIEGSAKFRNYDNFRKFVDFIAHSENLRFLYKIPLANGNSEEYFKDVLISNIPKGIIEDEDGRLFSTITFDCLSLWYQDNEIIYTIDELETEVQWNFRWDARFSDYKTRIIDFENDGHVEAPFELELDNYLIKPRFYIIQGEKTINSLKFDFTLTKGEKILYSSRDNKLFLKRQHTDGTIENMFTQQYIDINNNNIFKIPKGISQFIIEADNDIYDAKLNIFKQYEVV